MRSPRCDSCDEDVDPDCMHLVHNERCLRFADGWCRCDSLWVCAACCPDSDCVTPLAAALREAHDATEGVQA